MFILVSALLAMHSTYIGQLLRPVAAPLNVHMRVRLGGVAMICDYQHPAIVFSYNFFRVFLPVWFPDASWHHPVLVFHRELILLH